MATTAAVPATVTPPLWCCCYVRATYCYAVLLLLLLPCLRYVFAADPREHGYYASHPLSVMCLRIFKLKDGFICFGSCTSTVS